MTKKTDDGFTSRALMALVTAIAEKNYQDAEVVTAALAKEHGVGDYAERVMSQITLIGCGRRAFGAWVTSRCQKHLIVAELHALRGAHTLCFAIVNKALSLKNNICGQ